GHGADAGRELDGETQSMVNQSLVHLPRRGGERAGRDREQAQWRSSDRVHPQCEQQRNQEGGTTDAAERADERTAGTEHQQHEDRQVHQSSTIRASSGPSTPGIVSAPGNAVPPRATPGLTASPIAWSVKLMATSMTRCGPSS